MNHNSNILIGCIPTTSLKTLCRKNSVEQKLNKKKVYSALSPYDVCSPENYNLNLLFYGINTNQSCKLT